MDSNVKSPIKENVAHFIQEYRAVLIVFMALIVLGIIAAVVYEEVMKAQRNSVTAAVEEIETAYEAINSAKDDNEKSAAQKAFADIEANIQKSFSGTFAQQRSYFYDGNLKFAAKDFVSAEAAYFKSAKVLEKSYLSPIALMNAAISAEAAGNIAKTKEYLTSLAKNYAKSSPLSTRALFNLGRISESEKKWTEARDSYQKIIDTFTTSSWTKLARDRIIYLKAQGLL